MSMSVPLHCQSPRNRLDDVSLRAKRHRRIALWIAVSVLVLVGVWTMMFTSAGSRWSDMDAVTGTVRWTRTYPFGYRSTWYDVSSLEARLCKMNYAWTPNWILC